MTENYRTELSAFGIETCIIEPGGFPTGFMGNLMHPSESTRNESYGDLAEAPAASLEGFSEFLRQNPQQKPQLVADAVVSLLAARVGKRPFRTPVDTIGMGDAVAGYNDHLAQITVGIYSSMGIEGMLTLAVQKADAAG